MAITVHHLLRMRLSQRRNKGDHRPVAAVLPGQPQSRFPAPPKLVLSFDRWRPCWQGNAKNILCPFRTIIKLTLETE